MKLPHRIATILNLGVRSAFLCHSLVSTTIVTAAEESVVPSNNNEHEIRFLSSNPKNVKVEYYYDFRATKLPEAGLRTLGQPNKIDYVGNIDYPQSTGYFATSGQNEMVAALFEGFLAFPSIEAYEICITSDDGSKLKINDGSNFVIDNDGTHADETKCKEFTPDVSVKPIQIEYFQHGGEATLILKFRKVSEPSSARRVVSASEFVAEPSSVLSINPSQYPSDVPSQYPSDVPSQYPSDVPSQYPSDVPSDIPPIAQATSLSSNKHFISLAHNSTDVLFNDYRTSDEIKFFLNVTNADLTEDNLGSSIPKVYAGLHCNGTDDLLPASVLSVTTDVSKKELGADEIYAQVPVNIDVNTTDIVTIGALYAGYFTAESEKVTMKFCVMPELGSVDGVVIDGETKSSSISYTKINFVVEIDMKKGFESASVTVSEVAPEENNQNTQVDYELNACECYADNKECIDQADIQSKTQNSAISICIFTDPNNNVAIADIKDMKIEDTSSGVSYLAVTANMPNTITEVTDKGSKKVMVTTRLVSVFFSRLASSGGTATLDVTGTAVLEFESGSRKLVNIRGGYKIKEEQESRNLAVRDLKDGTAGGLVDFEMPIEIADSSTSGGSSTMKAVAIMLGVIGVVFV